jgi:hypothetical protein
MGSHPTATRESPSNELEKRKQALDQCQNLITHFEIRANQNKRLFQWLRNLSVILTVSSIAAVEDVPRWIVAAVISNALVIIAPQMMRNGRDFLPSGLPTCGLRVTYAGNAAGLRSSNNWNCRATELNDGNGPNHALQRTAAGHRSCNRRASWLPSLSLSR